MITHIIWVFVACGLFLFGLQLGEMRSFERTNKVVTIVDNPNCIVGRMI